MGGQSADSSMEILLKLMLLALFSVANLLTVGSESSSVIEEINSSYSCCELIIKFDPSCENIFRIGDKNFAHVSDHSKPCISPCKTINDTVMVLDACVNVNVTTVCTNDEMKTKETHTNYLGQECPKHLRSRMSTTQGPMGFLLLMLLTVIWMIQVF